MRTQQQTARHRHRLAARRSAGGSRSARLGRRLRAPRRGRERLHRRARQRRGLDHRRLRRERGRAGGAGVMESGGAPRSRRTGSPTSSPARSASCAAASSTSSSTSCATTPATSRSPRSRRCSTSGRPPSPRCWTASTPARKMLVDGERHVGSLRRARAAGEATSSARPAASSSQGRTHHPHVRRGRRVAGHRPARPRHRLRRAAPHDDLRGDRLRVRARAARQERRLPRHDRRPAQGVHLLGALLVELRRRSRRGPTRCSRT